MRFFIYLIFLLAVVSCNTSSSFYSYYAEEDLYRLPLIPPYQMTNLASDWSKIREHSWTLKLLHYRNKHDPVNDSLNKLQYQPEIRASEINVTANGIIYGHNKKAESEMEVWFVIIPKEKVEKFFYSKEIEWKKYLEEKGVRQIEFFQVWPLFDNFRKTLSLPWHNKTNIQG